MYGLTEATVLAYNWLIEFLNTYDYYHVPGTADFWNHETKLTVFYLCVDDIGLEYDSKEDLTYFLTTIKNYYDYHIDHQGSNYMTSHLNGIMKKDTLICQCQNIYKNYSQG